MSNFLDLALGVCSTIVDSRADEQIFTIIPILDRGKILISDCSSFCLVWE